MSDTGNEVVILTKIAAALEKCNDALFAENEKLRAENELLRKSVPNLAKIPFRYTFDLIDEIDKYPHEGPK